MGDFVTLEPLEDRHHPDLLDAAGNDPAMWTYLPVDPEKGLAARLPWIAAENAHGRLITLVVRRNVDGAVVGSSSYQAIHPMDARVEIGFTWYSSGAQGSAVNPDCKYLLLENAFAAGYNRVEFKADPRNARSRAALRKLGAVEEGVLREQMWMPQGYFRDSVYFSILASEWPSVKSGLMKRLAGLGAIPQDSSSF